MGDQHPFIGVLFSDLESSTRLWQEHPLAMKTNMVRHDEIVDSLIAQHGGKVIDHAGDGVFAVFEGGDPLGCAVAIQLALQEENWEEVAELRIRMGLHAGVAHKRDQDYRGPLINKSARIMGTAWGGQIVVTPDIVQKFPLPNGATTQDLGLHQLKDLDAPQQILGLIHQDVKLKEFPALRSLSNQPNNLPLQNTAFVGREDELAWIADHLKNPASRMLTLLGPGGIGKTRLALQAAANAIDRFPHGVYFVYLAPVDEVGLVVSAIAEALKFSFYAGKEPKEQLLQYLAEKEMLLVVDNLEHLTEAADILAEVLANSPKLQMIVTSRERLRLSEETLFPLEGLTLPNPGDDLKTVEASGAGQLFLERARQVEPGFSLEEEDLSYFIRLCDLVDGAPLGIELAAGWVRMLACPEIVEEIEKQMDFLESSQRDVVARHRSLRAVFEYSWNLLSDAERATFCNLSVFRGSWTTEAAKQVTGAPLMTLSQFLDKSLLRRTSRNRFFVQEMLRHYAQEKLEQEEDAHKSVKNAHAHYYADLLRQQTKTLKGFQQQKALETVEADLGNVRAAWEWAVDQRWLEDLENALEGFCLYFERRGRFQDGSAVCDRGLEIPPDGSDAFRRLRGRLFSRKGWFLSRLGHYKLAKTVLTDALVVAESLSDEAEQAYCLNHLGSLALIQGEAQAAADRFNQSLALRRGLGDDAGIAASLNNLATYAYMQGDFARSKSLFEESLGLSRQQDDSWTIAACLSNLGEITRLLGEYEQAEAYAKESLALRESLEDRWGIAASLNNLGVIAHLRGNLDEARDFYEQSLKLRREMGDRQGIATSRLNLGVIALEQGRAPEAKQMVEESLTMRRSLGDRRGTASCLAELGYAELELGAEDQALECFLEAIAIAQKIGAAPIALQSLVGVAAIKAQSQPDEAVKMLTFVLSQPNKTANTEQRAKRLLEGLKAAPSEEKISEAGRRDLADVVGAVLAKAK